MARALPIVFLLLAHASHARAQVCIAPSVREAVSRCPQRGPASTERERPSVPPPHLAPAPRRTERPEASEARVEVDVHVDPRRELRARRDAGLMRREVETLERILARADDEDPRTADYLIRLGETFVELQAHWTAAERSLDQTIFEARQRGERDRVAQLERQQREAHAEVARVREAAIRVHARLVASFPDHPRIDEVLYQLAFALEEIEQLDRARQVYFRLLREHPTSRFVPHAYLAFAEHAFEQGEMDEARQLYERVTQIPPERNPLYGYALYRGAWTRYQLEDFRGALAELARTIEFAVQNPDARDAAMLARQARRELVLPYARVGTPRQALAFFRRYADGPAEALEMLESLGEAYRDSGQWSETIQVYHQLMSEEPASARLCVWQGQVTSAVISSRPPAEQVIEVRRLLDVAQAFARGEHGADAIATCRGAAATTVVELATAWHREAVGDGEQPGTRDRTTMARASALYEAALESFPDLDRLQYPDLDRRDWPTRARLSYFHAELLWTTDDFERCGPAFDRVVELDPDGELSSDAAYGAVLCYDRVYRTGFAARERERRDAGDPSAPRELDPLEQRMLAAFDRFACTARESVERPVVLYRRARLHYEARHFAEAAVLFRDVAWAHPEHELGPIAANLYLDSLAALAPAPDGSRDGERACFAEIESSLAPLRALYCATEQAADAHAEICDVVSQLECDLLRQRAEERSTAGDHARAAEIYRTILTDHRACGRLDEVVYDLAIEYEAQRLLGRAIRARIQLIERFPTSPLVPRATFQVAGNYHALAIYSQAADWYERFARAHPDETGASCRADERDAGTCPIAHVALEHATFFRLAFGEEEAARQDAELYERHQRRARPAETAQVALSLASIYERRQDWPQLHAHVRTWIREHARHAPPHEVIRAHVLLGRAQWESGDRDASVAHFRAAVQAFERRPAPGTDDASVLAEARARDAASEALFHLAEREHDAFRAIRFPRLPSTRTLTAVTRWAERDLRPWLVRKIAALDAARAAYDRIAPLAVPRWHIAAASRIGEMYQTIVDEVRTSPVPTEIEQDDELYGIYLDALEAVLNGSTPQIACHPESTEPTCVRAPLRQARVHFETCLSLATRVRWFDERSQACEARLHDHDAQRYPIASELRGTAAHVVEDPARPRPLQLTRDAGDAEVEPSARTAPRS